MSKVYVFLNDRPAAPSTTPKCADVYCPPGGYYDRGMNRDFGSKGEKYRFLRAHGMREATLANPDQSIGGSEGRAIKQRGRRGNFAARPVPTWMTQELARHMEASQGGSHA